MKNTTKIAIVIIAIIIAAIGIVKYSEYKTDQVMPLFIETNQSTTDEIIAAEIARTNGWYREDTLSSDMRIGMVVHTIDDSLWISTLSFLIPNQQPLKSFIVKTLPDSSISDSEFGKIEMFPIF